MYTNGEMKVYFVCELTNRSWTSKETYEDVRDSLSRTDRIKYLGTSRPRDRQINGGVFRTSVRLRALFTCTNHDREVTK